MLTNETRALAVAALDYALTLTDERRIVLLMQGGTTDRLDGYVNTLRELLARIKDNADLAAPDATGVAQATRLICATCNDYLEHPSYCEVCYSNITSAYEEAQEELDKLKQAQAAQWEPVGNWSFQESMNRDIEHGGRSILNVDIKESRFIHLWDSEGQEIAVALRPNYAVCRQVEQPDALTVPDSLKYIVMRYSQDHSGEDHQARVKEVRAWLAALGQEA